MSGRAVFVTGAGGIVGRHLVESLSLGGHSVYATARLPLSPPLPSKHFLQADLAADNAADKVEAFLSGLKGPITLVHLAAAVPHNLAYTDEDACGKITRRIDSTISQLQSRLGCRIIYMSSCGLYDRHDRKLKVASSAKITASSPYFAAKLAGEKLMLSRGSVTVLRLSAPIGAGIPEALAIRKMARSLHDTGSIHVWGRGTREQDFIDVRDVSAVLTRAALGPARTGIFNLASGVASSMSDLARALIDALGWGRIIYGNTDPNEGLSARYDIAATRDAFDWRPEILLKSSCAYWQKELF